MAAEKKYFWLKLKRDFFKRHDIRIVEAMPNGKDYILFYLKLLLESVDHNGSLRFSDTVPYNADMLAIITNTNVDIVRAAMKVFEQLQMIEILDDETIYMLETEKMIGSETAAAERKRRQRAAANTAKTASLTATCDNVTNASRNSHIELEKEKEKEKDIEEKNIKKNSEVTRSSSEGSRSSLEDLKNYILSQGGIL